MPRILQYLLNTMGIVNPDTYSTLAKWIKYLFFPSWKDIFPLPHKIITQPYMRTYKLLYKLHKDVSTKSQRGGCKQLGLFWAWQKHFLKKKKTNIKYSAVLCCKLGWKPLMALDCKKWQLHLSSHRGTVIPAVSLWKKCLFPSAATLSGTDSKQPWVKNYTSPFMSKPSNVWHNVCLSNQTMLRTVWYRHDC